MSTSYQSVHIILLKEMYKHIFLLLFRHWKTHPRRSMCFTNVRAITEDIEIGQDDVFCNKKPKTTSNSYSAVAPAKTTCCEHFVFQTCLFSAGLRGTFAIIDLYVPSSLDLSLDLQKASFPLSYSFPITRGNYFVRMLLKLNHGF